MEVVLRLIVAYLLCWFFVPVGIILFAFIPTIGAFLGVVVSYELAGKMIN